VAKTILTVIDLRSPSINVSIKADIRGNISKEIFQEALNYTVKRYAILRSSIEISPNGQAYYDIKDGKTIAGVGSRDFFSGMRFFSRFLE
jgi:hypothetical protein